MTQILNDIPVAQQLEICGMLSKCMKPNGQLVLNMPNTKSVFQVDLEPDNDDILLAEDIDHVFIGGLEDHNHIILDTGSSYNLIGKHLLTLLKHRLEQAGARAVVVAANKKFQFGGSIRVKSEGKIMVPMMLGNTRLETEVYVVDTKIPFLLGGNLLRQYNTEISVSDNQLILDNQKISLKLLPTGHMAIP